MLVGHLTQTRHEFWNIPAQLAPGRVLCGEAEDESSDLVWGWWSSWSLVGLCPVGAMRRRCHRGRVSGVTIHSVSCGRGSAAAMAPSSVRSSSLTVGRLIWRRRTPSWWRSTMISSSLDRPERTSRRASMAMRQPSTRDRGCARLRPRRDTLGAGGFRRLPPGRSGLHAPAARSSSNESWSIEHRSHTSGTRSRQALRPNSTRPAYEKRLMFSPRPSTIGANG